jgi:hypothetical protein
MSRIDSFNHSLLFLSSLILCSLAFFAAEVRVIAQDIFAMPVGLKSLEFVEVSSSGNQPDSNGYGAVPYDYRISKFEITTAQWVAFLNSKARSERDGGLWNNDMDKSRSGDGVRCEIRRSGDEGSYSYSVADEFANRPVTHVSYLDACRFCNWLHNGQADGDVETGAYTLKGYWGTDGRRIRRNPGAKYFIPTENEWYKAAYFDPQLPGAGGYWKYPTRSNQKPSRQIDSINGANWFDQGYLDPVYYFTQVGSFSKSSSPWGTYDQAGNVFEWTEGLDPPFLRTLRGGAFDSTDAGESQRIMNPVYSSISDVPNIGLRIGASTLRGSLQPAQFVATDELKEPSIIIGSEFLRRPWLDPLTGTPFFPLAWFSYASDEADLDELARQGANLVLFVAAPADVDTEEQTTANIAKMIAYLDAAQARKIRVLIQVGGFYSAHMRNDQLEIARQKRWVESIAHHPAIFGYQLYDEPEYRAGFGLGVADQEQLRQVVDALGKTRDSIRIWDKNHKRMISVVFNLVPLSSWSEYLPTVDSFQIDRYPLDREQAYFGHRGDWGPAMMAWSMAHGAHALSKHAHLRNPSPCMQGVGSEHTENGVLGIWRTPLYDESRYMAYSSLTVGAWGVFHWIRAFGRPQNPIIDDNVGRLYRELNTLRPALESSYERPAFQVAHNYNTITRGFLTDSMPDITTLALEDDVNYYVIVSDNSGTFNNVTLRLQGLELPDHHARTATVLNEGWGRSLGFSEETGEWMLDPHTMCFGDINIWVIPKGSIAEDGED